MSGKSTTLAVFDLDGTITTKDTYLEFIKYAVGNGHYYLGLAVLSPYIIAYYLKLYPNYRLKEKFFSYYFKGEVVESLNSKGDLYSTDEIPKITRQGALKVLNWHKSEGHTILILSASADIWLEKWCNFNKFELICTKFEVSNGHYTGQIEGENCFGEEKKKRLESYLKAGNFEFSYGYGDSSADKYFLELVDVPYLMPLEKEKVENLWRPINNKT
jgi:HAD superfamily hydrolase (TIGR01490 family)